MVEIFVPGIGQYDNIGDIILRRQLLRWLAPLGRLHVFVGQAPEGYAESLELRATDVVYTSFRRWYAKAMRTALQRRAAYVFKPGEIQITMLGLKEHISMLPLQLLIKAGSQPVVRVGAGARGFGRIPRTLMKPSLALTDLIAWRDARTAAFLGKGEVMPDLAFGEGSPAPRGEERRDLLVVSMRSDRPFPSDAWFAAVKQVAAQRTLNIVSIVQVERDAERSRALADRLGGSYHPWVGSDHEEHERALRALYRRTSLTVSDRLHVLITACTEGSVPIAPLVDDSDKIERHFDAAGIPFVAIRTRGLSSGIIATALNEAADDWARVADGLRNARTRLDTVRGRLTALLAGDRDARTRGAQPTVWHVGRRGEVAGGMTQVVNAYLAWPFKNVRLRLLRSRNGKRGPGAIGLFALAMIRLPLLGRRDRTIVAVHLSQGGSFSREGLLLRLASRFGYRTVAHLHGSSFVDFATSSPRAVTRALQSADLIVALSSATFAAVERLLPSARIELVPNAVAAGEPRPKESIVVFGGGVTRRKGVDVLIEAWAQAAPSDEWQLHIAGPAIEADLLDALPAGVSGLGAMEHTELMSLLDRSAIAVLPSRDEAMPMFILEALARGNAVISTTVGGIPEVLGEGAGVLVAPGSVGELAAAITLLTDSAERRATVADVGHGRFESEYSAASVYPRVEKLWLSALD